MTQSPAHPSATVDPGTMILVMCSDKNYAMPLCVTICSIVINLKPYETAIIYLLDAGMIDHERVRLVNCVNRISKQVRVIFCPVDINALSDIKQVGFYGAGTYIRLLIPALIPADVEKIMFLDSDLVARSSVSGLWNQPLDGMPVAAIQDQYLMTLGADMGPVKTYGLNELDPKLPYVNAGVTIWDLKMWRSESIAESMTRFLHDYADRLKWADQDALNVVLAGRIRVLDKRWNYQYGALPAGTSLPEKHRRLSESHIVHYTGPHKPWTPGVFDPERKEFLKYLRRSGWMGDIGFAKFYAGYIGKHIRIRYLDWVKLRIKSILKHAIKG